MLSKSNNRIDIFLKKNHFSCHMILNLRCFMGNIADHER